MQNMFQADQPIDILTVADFLKNENHAPTEGWNQFLNNCLDACPVYTHWERYADELKEL
jgi:replicative DNA helicase